LPRLPASLLHERDIAKRAARGLFGSCAGEIFSAHELLSFLFDVLAEFFAEILVKAAVEDAMKPVHAADLLRS
jgi:hypothetical protein